jgi:hypothetical protein
MFRRKSGMRLAQLAIPAALAVALAAAAPPARSVQNGRISGSVKFYLDVRFAQSNTLRFARSNGEGTFATSGAFTDSGTFTSFFVGRSLSGQTKLWRRFGGRRGAMVIQEVLSETETGSWSILSGTGAYAGLRGRGTSIGSGLGSNLGDVIPPTRAIAVATGTVSMPSR